MSQGRRDSAQEQAAFVVGVSDQNVIPKTDPTTADLEKDSSSDEEKSKPLEDDDNLEIRKKAWGKRGRVFIWIGVALMWTVFELDYTTIYNYQNYAASDFQQISLLGAITTAGTIISAVLKPPVAKISDVAGRAETYVTVVIIYIISYVLCASAQAFGQYAAGFVIYSVGQAGLQILNQIIIADITSSRWRGLANGLVQIPYLAIPFAAAFITDAVLANIGWRWGIGMYAIITPVCSLTVIAPLFLYQRQLRKLGGVVHQRTTTIGFLSEVDFGGSVLLIAGCAMVLLPMALAGNTSRGWATPWIPALMVVGVLCLTFLAIYEKKFSRNPIIPPASVKNVSLVLACLLGLLDSLAYQVTHTYLYAFVTTVYDFSPRNATFLTYTAGCLQVLSGLVTGYLMYKTKKYKWLVLIGVIVRLIGYGVMMRLRGANNSVAELFVVQVIQGAGSGIVGTVVIVVAQVVVSRKQLAQMTALILLFIYLGNAVGAAVAGGIYTNLFKEKLMEYSGPSATIDQVDDIYNSIIEAGPRLGSQERDVVNRAYGDVFRYMTIAALVASAIPMVLVWFLPNLELSNKHNLADQTSSSGKRDSESQVRSENETRVERWKRWTRW